MSEPTPEARADAREQLAEQIERLIDQLDSLDANDGDPDLEAEEDACDDADGRAADTAWTEPKPNAMQRSPMVYGDENEDDEEDDAGEDGDAGEDNGDHEAVSARNHCDQTEWAHHTMGTEDDEDSPDDDFDWRDGFGTVEPYIKTVADDAILDRLRADRDRPRTVQVTGPDGIRLARFEPLPRRDIPMTIRCGDRLHGENRR
jgi:hypothetical protein